MSPPGRPKGESLSAKREGRPVNPPGRPKGESLSAKREGRPLNTRHRGVAAARGHGPAPRGGYALLVLVGLFGSVALLALTGWLAAGLRVAAAGTDQDRAAYLRAAGVALAGWYERQADVIDADARRLDEATLLSQAVGSRRFGLRAAASERLLRDAEDRACVDLAAPDCVAFRRLVLWLPPADVADASTFDPASGLFTAAAGALAVSIDGRAVQQRRVEATWRALRQVAAHFMLFYNLRQSMDPFPDVTRNHFAARACAAPELGELPCLTEFTALAGTAIPSVAGLDDALLRDAWGRPIEAVNAGGPVSLAVPYSMAFRAVAPWGAGFEVFAVQPL